MKNNNKYYSWFCGVVMFFCFSVNSFAMQKSFELRFGGKKEDIDISILKVLPKHSFRTSTNYTDVDTFSGVKFEDFAAAYNIKGTTIRVFAWDGYSFSIPISELMKYNVIIAYEKGGELMDSDTLGPFALVYPRDLYPDLDHVDADARTIWQIKSILVR